MTGAGWETFRYRREGPVDLLLGDAGQVLAAMPDAMVDTVVTSPPFWSLRDYGTGRWDGADATCPHPVTSARRADGTTCPACPAVWTDPQYGLEATVEDYVDRLVGVFNQVRRVLKPTGTLWVNLGDSYTAADKLARPFAGARAAGESGVLPGKHLVGVPWRVAFALQASGWWLRNAVVWSKTNPMPESVTDRLSTTYELLFLLTPSARYYFDLDPIRVPLARPDAVDGTRTIGGAHKGTVGGVGATQRRRGSRYGTAQPKYGEPDAVVEPRARRGNLARSGVHHSAAHPRGRNPGDVWRLATRPYRGAHVAPFPVDIPLRAIAAGCPPGGVVLDPFSGAATTGLAAVQLGRSYIGVDVRAEFHDEALVRLRPYLPNRPEWGG